MADDPTAPDSEDARENGHEAPEPELVHGVPVSFSRGQRVAHPTRAQYRELLDALHREGYLTCLDVTAVDYLTHPGRALPEGVDAERFEVVVEVLAHRTRERLRIRVQVPEADATVPSLFELHPGTEAMEREAYDMFGIVFEGHPDLTRILMPEDWQGHPLRKDYDSGRIPVQFKGVQAGR
jgi:NADH-quinone oxidoreductase subunit C